MIRNESVRDRTRKPTTRGGPGAGWRRAPAFRLATATCVLFACTEPATARAAGATGGNNAMIVITPRKTDALLANPGMGWETFHRTRLQDKNLPDWIPSTVHYARWGWGTLEPTPGKIDFEFLDKVLAETRAAGQKLAFRVMCCSTTPGKPYHPKWLAEVGGRILMCRYRGKGPLPVPDLDDPEVLERHIDFIQRLGKRYDGSPDIDHVDLGSVGWWGEWHMSGTEGCRLPSLKNRMKIVDAYLAAFRKTPLLMLINGGECLTYAVRHGTGWRADCIGDLGGFSKQWCHMRQGYPGWIRQAGIEDAWRRAPVAWETCWDMRKWVKEGWPLRYIFNYALALHGSYLNNKSAPLPTAPGVREEIERFLRRLGYRLVLRKLAHPARVPAGSKFTIRMVWQNTGSAPCYRPYRLAFRLSGPHGFRKVFATSTTVNGWMPGSVDLFTDAFFKAPPDLPDGPPVQVDETISLPESLPAGEYTLAIAVVGVDTEAPVVQLGIEGRGPDGWYALSKVTIEPPLRD